MLSAEIQLRQDQHMVPDLRTYRVMRQRRAASIDVGGRARARERERFTTPTVVIRIIGIRRIIIWMALSIATEYMNHAHMFNINHTDITNTDAQHHHNTSTTAHNNHSLADHHSTSYKCKVTHYHDDANMRSHDKRYNAANHSHDPIESLTQRIIVAMHIRIPLLRIQMARIPTTIISLVAHILATRNIRTVIIMQELHMTHISVVRARSGARLQLARYMPTTTNADTSHGRDNH